MTNTKKIAVIPGDGIGKEVVAEGLKVLGALREHRGLDVEVVEFDLGADRFLADGTTFPEEVRNTIRDECAAVLLGAMGDPRVPRNEHAKDIIFGLRFGFDLYCNIRPVVCLHDRLMPLKGRTAQDCNFVVFRENTEGIYVGMGGQFKRGTPDEVAINEDLNTRKGVERIVRAAFEYAVAHGRRRVHVVDKSNAMQAAHELWRRCFFEVAAEYPVAIGSPEYPTPSGLFAIQNMQVDPPWNVPNSDWAGDLAGTTVPGGAPDNPLVARWLGVSGPVGIHGTPSIYSLGSAASHGCIRMSESDVIALYDQVDVGTPVYIG